MRSHIPNIVELFNQSSTKIERLQNHPLWISKVDLEYAYGKLKLSKKKSKHCNFAKTGGNMNGY